MSQSRSICIMFILVLWTRKLRLRVEGLTRDTQPAGGEARPLTQAPPAEQHGPLQGARPPLLLSETHQDKRAQPARRLIPAGDCQVGLWGLRPAPNPKPTCSVRTVRTSRPSFPLDLNLKQSAIRPFQPEPGATSRPKTRAAQGCPAAQVAYSAQHSASPRHGSAEHLQTE